MGHLDNTERVVEARLTALGRRKLAEGDGLDISQFALADDEVDYKLWQEQLPEEDAGAIIENLPTYEAFTDETQSMRYKLVSLEPNSDNVPQISVDSDLLTINLDQQNEFGSSPVDINPTTTLDWTRRLDTRQSCRTEILQICKPLRTAPFRRQTQPFLPCMGRKTGSEVLTRLRWWEAHFKSDGTPRTSQTMKKPFSRLLGTRQAFR